MIELDRDNPQAQDFHVMQWALRLSWAAVVGYMVFMGWAIQHRDRQIAAVVERMKVENDRRDGASIEDRKAIHAQVDRNSNALSKLADATVERDRTNDEALEMIRGMVEEQRAIRKAIEAKP